MLRRSTRTGGEVKTRLFDGSKSINIIINLPGPKERLVLWDVERHEQG